MTRDETFAELAKRGFAKVVVHYSGGNDEGGVDQDIELLLANGQLGDTMSEPTWPAQWDGQKWLEPTEVTEDDRLAHDLCAPVYDKWGGFAGDFCTDGTITWDVTARTVTDSGEIGETAYTGYEDEV